MKKRIINIVLLIILSFIMLISCSNSENKNEVKNNKINIITTIFPIYDVTKILCKGIDTINLTLLMDSGVDLHNYSPDSKDLINISKSNLFIYIGGESDKWVDEAFASLNIDNGIKLNLMDVSKSHLKEEELKEGMEDRETEAEEHDEKEYDEHIWLSLKLMKILSKEIKQNIEKKLDDSQKALLEDNYKNFVSEIESLDKKYEELVNSVKASKKTTTLLFADRFPFRYFVDDYGIDYFAAFKGCSAESEASFKTVVFLADKINELDLKNIFVLDDSDKKIANTVIENSKKEDVGILVLDSMQSKTLNDVENGISYMDIMNKNYDTLVEYYK